MILPAEYKLRREKVRNKMGGQELLALFPTPLESNQGTESSYEPNRNLLYLSANPTPSGALFLTKTEEVLFLQPKQSAGKKQEQNLWSGPPENTNEQLAELGGFTSTQLRSYAEPSELLRLLESLLWDIRWQKLYLDIFSLTPQEIPLVFGMLERLREKKSRTFGDWREIANPGNLIHPQRLIKSPAEIECMQESLTITIQAHQAVQEKNTRKKLANEMTLHGILEKTFICNGCRPAYPPIVAADERAVILHYTRNNQPIKNDSLILVDAGASKNFYAADLTRTWPMREHFTPPQAAIYTCVYDALQLGISLCKLGSTFTEVEARIAAHFIQRLIDWKILTRTLDEEIELHRTCSQNHRTCSQNHRTCSQNHRGSSQNHRTCSQNHQANTKQQLRLRDFYPHRIGHWIGMEVHDVGDPVSTEKDQNGTVKTIPREFKENMVLTIEPGLYFQKNLCENSPAAQKFSGLGIRLEEMILITKEGPKNLSADLPCFSV